MRSFCGPAVSKVSCTSFLISVICTSCRFASYRIPQKIVFTASTLLCCWVEVAFLRPCTKRLLHHSETSIIHKLKDVFLICNICKTRGGTWICSCTSKLSYTSSIECNWVHWQLRLRTCIWRICWPTLQHRSTIGLRVVNHVVAVAEIFAVAYQQETQLKQRICSL